MECIRNYVGIDISKLFFDVAISNQDIYRHYKFANDTNGFKELLNVLAASNAHVVMEASGPYYLKLASYLFEKEITVSVVNPLVVRRFCQMRLSRTKTDKKDAKMIAAYGKTEKPAIWVPEPAYILELRQMQATVDQLNKNKGGLLRQQEAFDQNTVLSKENMKVITTVIRCIEKQIAVLESKMQQLTEQYHGRLYNQLQTIPGLGKKTAMLLIVLSDGFKRFSNPRQLSSYFGLSPRTFESGTSVKGRCKITKMGMSRIRAMLYVCAWSAKKYNKSCKELYDRLVAKGKSKRLALIAVANKLIKQAFALAVNDTTYQENYQKNICF
jgi:transposase